ncbi:MAG: hypothetical protein CML20_04735 [Rheinheimera sp.]|nr:hypothetical protein [Rheinheimera sp.]
MCRCRDIKVEILIQYHSTFFQYFSLSETATITTTLTKPICGLLRIARLFISVSESDHYGFY